MSPDQLVEQIRIKQSMLCVGLDPDLSRIPKSLRASADPVYEFCRQIIESTLPYTVAYKPNLAFFEALGPAGWDIFARVRALIPSDVLVIADAKRGDIGNTARRYATAFFDTYRCDGLTVAPYMGRDSVQPFLSYRNHWTFVLALTSNEGSTDFQYVGEKTGAPLYERVVQRANEWGATQPGYLGFVVGATRSDRLARIRNLAPGAFFLVPGIGAQGGSLREVMQYGQNARGGLLINSSRGILYASSGADFAQAAAAAARNLQREIATLMRA